MKSSLYLLLLFSLILPLASKAQNWHPMRFGAYYGYQLGDTTTYGILGKRAYVLRVNAKTPGSTSGDTLYNFNPTLQGGDSTRFPLPASCQNVWQPIVVPGNVFGAYYRHTGDALIFYNSLKAGRMDSCVLPLRLAVGQAFAFNASLQGTLTGRTAFIGPLGLDSMLKYTIGSHTVTLTKNLGLFEAFSWGGKTPLDPFPSGHMLNKMQLEIVPELGIGTSPISVEDYSPYQPGDSIAFDQSWWASSPPIMVPYPVQHRFKILNRTRRGDTLELTYRDWAYTMLSFRMDTATLSMEVLTTTSVLPRELNICTGEPVQMPVPLYGSLERRYTFGTAYLKDNKPVLTQNALFEQDAGTCPYKVYGYMIDGEMQAYIAPGLGVVRENYTAWVQGQGQLVGYCRAGDSCPLPPLPIVGVRERFVRSSLTLSPNPATSFISVEFSGPATHLTASAIDALGRTHFLSYTRTATGARVDVSALAKGLYRMRVLAGNAVWTGSFAKE